MAINCYINFKGNCKEAVHFYESVFQTKAKIMTYADMPERSDMQVDSSVKDLVMHGQLEFCQGCIMCSDVLPDMELIQGNQISISLSGEDEKQLIEWFQKLSENGTVIMPLEHTFWSGLYGLVIDKYGIHWHINKIN